MSRRHCFIWFPLVPDSSGFSVPSSPVVPEPCGGCDADVPFGVEVSLTCVFCNLSCEFPHYPVSVTQRNISVGVWVER